MKRSNVPVKSSQLKLIAMCDGGKARELVDNYAQLNRSEVIPNSEDFIDAYRKHDAQIRSVSYALFSSAGGELEMDETDVCWKMETVTIISILNLS